MAKKSISITGLTVVAGSMNGNGSQIQLAAEIKKIAAAQPNQPNAIARTVISISHADPEWFKQFSQDQKVTVDINIS